MSIAPIMLREIYLLFVFGCLDVAFKKLLKNQFLLTKKGVRAEGLAGTLFATWKKFQGYSNLKI